MSEEVIQSRLAVLLFSDLVDSTGLKSRVGTAAYSKLLARHNGLFESLCRRFPRAQILKHTGDGYFAAFDTASDAVRFALLFQRAIRTDDWDGSPLTTRVGIHVGEVATVKMADRDDVVGLAADVAARIMSLAEGGQILLTREAFNNARQFIEKHPASPSPDDPTPVLQWLAHGQYLFDGLDEAIEVFEVGAEGEAPLSCPVNKEKAARVVPHDQEKTLGWRPAVGLEVPSRIGWKLQGKLGEGGFGEVWLARHDRTKERRVFKFCFDVERLRSFKRELTLFRLLRDALGDRPDIARLYDVQLDRPPFFLESEYTDGGNLYEWAERQGGLQQVPLAQRLEIVAKVADAVAAAHSIGILHKDIKPSNILIQAQADGTVQPRLSDFGIGILYTNVALQKHDITQLGFTQLTQNDSSRTGTRMYAPPESIADKPFTIQGDIYALGVLLHQTVIGRLERPLAAGWEREVDDDLLREDIAACIDGDPQRRPRSASFVSEHIRTLGARREERARQRTVRERARRRRALSRVAIGAAAVLSLLIVVLSIGLARERRLRQELARHGIALQVARDLAETRSQQAELRRVEAAQMTENLRRRDYFQSILLAQMSYDTRNIERMQEVLREAPADLRGWEWYRLLWLSDRSLRTLSGHRKRVQALQFTQDPAVLVSADGAGTVCWWDINTGSLIRQLTLSPWHAAAKMDSVVIELSSDGSRLAACTGAEQIDLFDTQQGKLVLVIPTPTQKTVCLAFSPDGRLLVAGTHAGAVRLYSLQTAEQVYELHPPSPRALGADVAYSPDGTLVSARTGFSLLVWDARSGQLLSNSLRVAHSLTFSPDSKSIAYGEVGRATTPAIQLARTGRVVVQARTGPPTHFPNTLQEIVFSPNGRTLIATRPFSTSFQLLDVRSGELLREYPGHNEPISSVVFDALGSRIASAAGAVIKIWDATPTIGDEVLWKQSAPSEVAPHRSGTEVWGISLDGKILASTGGSLQLIGDDRGDRLRAFPVSGKIRAGAITGDGRRAASLTADGTLEIWDTETGELVWTVARDLGRWPFNEICVSADGRWLGAVQYVLYSPNELRSFLRVWDLKNQKEAVWTARSDQAPPATAATDAKAAEHVTSVAMSPDGALVAVTVKQGKSATVVIRETASGAERRRLPSRMDKLVFTRDGSRLLGLSYDQIEVWTVDTGKQQAVLTGLPGSPFGVTFTCSPDGRRIVVCAAQGAAQKPPEIWDVESARHVLTLDVSEPVSSVLFTPDGQRLLLGTGAGIRVLEAAPQDPLSRSTAEAVRDGGD